LGDSVTTGDQLDFLARQLADIESGWSVGTFGAIAEFTRDAGEQAELCQSRTAISVVTARGGLSITSCPGLRLIASESPTKDSWGHRVALCLQRDSCAMSMRRALTEIGADHDALRAEDCGSILFDLGLGTLPVDICVRSRDQEVISALRGHAGKPLFATEGEAIQIILAANPHRVFLSRIGRAEVYQPIPPPGGRSPDGPHTHILPNLLAHGRTHATTEFLPDDYIPCGHLYPPHPLCDRAGRSYPFRHDLHDAFQSMLERYGDPHLLALKRHVIDSVRSGREPAAISIPNERFARATARVGLRQLLASESASPILLAWLSVYDQPGVRDTEDPMEALH
jgi:hypothetical protein